MKYLLALVVSVFIAQAYAIDFPIMPNPELTPGSLCQRPDTYRYPEHIAYCERNVDTDVKQDVFRKYREQLGFTLNISNRANYKIDHFFPLCAGGSNEENNLWPQHISVFTITDPLEAKGCEKLALGKITQKDLIELIKKAKFDLSLASKVYKQLQGL